MNEMIKDNRLLPFIGKVGTGARGAKNLSYEEAFDAMNAILDGAYHPVTLGAFLLAERWKPETPKEMAGFADAMQQRLVRPQRLETIPGLLNCACAYDGKKKSLNVGLPAALIASTAGVPILLHSSSEIPTKQGTTHYHVLHHLGIETNCTPTQAYETLKGIGIAYLHQPVFNPDMHSLLENRQQIGKRTFLNTIEPWANPFHAEYYLGGFFHRPFAEIVCRGITESKLGYKRVVAVAGIEGSNEVRPERSLIAEWIDGNLETYYLKSAALGLHTQMSDVETQTNDVETISEESANRILALLNENDQSGFHDAVLLNAAFQLFVTEKTTTLEEGVEIARECLTSGKCLEKLNQWKLGR